MTADSNAATAEVVPSGDSTVTITVPLASASMPETVEVPAPPVEVVTPNPEAVKAKRGPKKGSKAKKPVKAEVPAPTSGQSGPAIKIGYNELSANERKVLDCFDPNDKAHFTIAELSSKAFGGFKKSKANYFVRNQLRRLIRGNWLDKSAPGTYRLSTSGRNRLLKLER